MIVIAFKKNASKEFLFPNTAGLDHQAYIDKELFGLDYSFFISFENYRGQWSVVAKSGVYDLVYHQSNTESIALRGNKLFTVRTVDDQTLKIFAFDEKVSMRSFRKFSLSGADSVTIGKNPDNLICYDFENLVSGLHCVITAASGEHVITDYSSNGVFVNNKRVEHSRKLAFGDTITVFGLKIIYLNEMIAVNSHVGGLTVSSRLKEAVSKPVSDTLTHFQSKPVYFNRSPRRFYKLNNENVVIEPPGNLNVSKKRSLLMTIGPSFTMAIPMLLGFSLMIFSSMSSGYRTGVFMYTGLITAIGSAIFGSLWAYLNLKETKQREYDDESRRFNAYGNYLVKTGRYIEEKYEENRRSLLLIYPAAEECCAMNDMSPELWNRNHTHEDFLFYRLGLGDIDFQMHIKIPEEKFSLETDALKEKPAILYENFKTLRSVPVGIDCAKSGLFGIVSNDRRQANNIVNLIIAQIAATTCYTDAKIAFCYQAKSPRDLKRWDYIKWFPHTWSESRSMRYYATDKQEISEVLFELSNIMRQRAEDDSRLKKNEYVRPHYFLFISDPRLLEGELISKYVFDKEQNHGLTTFLIADHYSNLPNGCEDIIECDGEFCGVYNTVDRSEHPLPIAFDTVKLRSLNDFARRLSGIRVRETEEEVGLVSSLSFFEMHNIQSLEELEVASNWRRNKTYNSMRALIGKKAGGANCYLDIHEKHHGPHGLIAGTTGSGKSEFICTYLLSLAANYSPDDIAFFIIDFKGGGMGNSFLDLPHIAGQITNLSGNQIKRAMISVKSENIRRQKLFSDYGVNNISGYTQLYKSGKASIPMPHLLIIIDEFAELKKEEPEFMKELISVAQVGRSLGVHLILATQKPAGTVDDNIWSNSKFRVCLRVQDRQDSNDMLHKPDAAFITQAGRGYLQIGNDELYELFQSGWSGAIYKKEAENVDRIATMITNTGHTAIVGSHTLMKQKQEEKHEWYRQLYLTARSVLQQNSDSATDEKLLIKTIIEKLRESGYHMSDSEADYSAVGRFLRLMPGNIPDADEAVRMITMAAAEKNILLPELKEKTQLEAVVEYINRIADEEGYTYRTSLWMPLLPENLYLEEVFDPKQYYRDGGWVTKDSLSLSVEVGMYDDPWNQNQLPLTLDFLKGGHLAVCGTVVSGKSTFLQTMLFALSAKYSPEDINYYVLDFSGGMLSLFGEYPHTGGVIRDNEPDKTRKFFTMMEQKIAERKKLLDGGSFQQYRKSHKGNLPAILIVIDNFASFKEKTENAYESILVRLSREGESYGIYLVLSSAGFGMAEIQSRIGDNIRTVISLEMSDKFKYMDVLRTTRLDIQPEPGIKGRGLAYIGNNLMEFQTAVACKAADDYQRISVLESIGARMKAAWRGALPQMIPFIPEEPTYDILAATPAYQMALKHRELLPFAYRDSDAGIYSVELSRSFCYCITGKRRTGKTNTMKLLMSALKDRKYTAAVIEFGTRELKPLSEELGMEYLSDNESLTVFFKKITPTFVERNRLKRTMTEDGASDQRIYEAMQEYEPIFVFIADLIGFIRNLNQKDPENPKLNNKPFFENVFEKGYLHNVYFFGCINTDDAVNVAGDRAYNLFTAYKTGVHLGGNLSAQRIFNFQDVHYSLMTKTMKKGEGLVSDCEDDSVSHKIIIPVYGERL